MSPTTMEVGDGGGAAACLGGWEFIQIVSDLLFLRMTLFIKDLFVYSSLRSD